MAKTHSEWLNTITVPCKAIQTRRQQQSNKIPDQLATPEQVHGGQVGVVLSGYSHISIRCQTCQSQLKPRNSTFWLAAVFENPGRKKKPQKQIQTCLLSSGTKSRESCYHVAAIKNMVPGTYSRPVNMCAVSQQLRSLSLGDWLQEDWRENSSRSFQMMLGLNA